jgi:hypothetical protein
MSSNAITSQGIDALMKALEASMYWPQATPANISKEKLHEVTLTMLGWTKDPSGWYWSKTDHEGVKQQISIYKTATILNIESLDTVLSKVTYP